MWRRAFERDSCRGVRVQSRRSSLIVFILSLLIALTGPSLTQRTSAQAPVSVDLSRYVRVGRFDLPEPTRTSAPPNSLLAQEASAVTYNWDTGSLFIVGDGGTSVVQV